MSKMKERTLKAFQEGCVVSESGEVRKNGRVLKVRISGDYLGFTYGDKGARGPVHVHRLAALQWFGEVALLKEVQVRHLDGDKENNIRTNLALGTASQNMMDCPKEDRLERARKAASARRSLSEEQVRDLRERRSKGATYKELCAYFGIAKSTVSYIVSGKTYANLKT